MSGLATVAAALNANDPCLACIAAVHLRLSGFSRPRRARQHGGGRLSPSSRGIGNPALHPRAGTPPIPAGSRQRKARATHRPRCNRDKTTIQPSLRVRRLAAENHHRSEWRKTTIQRGAQTLRQSVGDDWVRLPPGPRRIDELADFVEWIANAKPEDEQAIRAEIRKILRRRRSRQRKCTQQRAYGFALATRHNEGRSSENS